MSERFAESNSVNSCAQGFDFFRMVNPKGLDGLAARGRVDQDMVHDLLSELYDLYIEDAPLHGLRTAVWRRLQTTYPDLRRDRCYQLLARLIVQPERDKFC
jgi:hypothetical protein